MTFFVGEKHRRLFLFSILGVLLSISICSVGCSKVVDSDEITNFLDLDEDCTVSIREVSMLDTRTYFIKGSALQDFKLLFTDCVFKPEPSWNEGKEAISCPTYYDIDVEKSNGDIMKMQYVSYGYLRIDDYMDRCPLEVDDDFPRKMRNIMNQSTVFIESYY